MSARVAYVCADKGIPVFGHKGASAHVREMIRAFRRTGAEVDLYATNLGGLPPSDLASVPLHHVPLREAEQCPSRVKAALRAGEAIARRLAASSYDIVYERYSLWSCASIEAARQAGAATVVEVNAPLIEEQALYRTLVDRERAESIARRAFAGADVLLAVSSGVADWVSSISPESANRIRVVPNAVDPSRFTPRAGGRRAGEPDTEFVIGFVGTLKRWHGLSALVEAFAIVRARRQARLLIVGDGPEGVSTKARLAELGLEADATFTGSVDPDQVPGLLGQMDVGVAPYPDLEKFYFSPLKVFEYMAAGLPVVASRVGQLPDVIDDGVNGLLCPPGDANAFADALLRIAASPALADRLGQCARTTVENRHSWDQVAARVLEVPSESLVAERV